MLPAEKVARNSSNVDYFGMHYAALLQSTDRPALSSKTRSLFQNISENVHLNIWNVQNTKSTCTIFLYL